VLLENAMASDPNKAKMEHTAVATETAKYSKQARQ
jgi:hypothetical protein